jgi:hypothetical protein
MGEIGEALDDAEQFLVPGSAQDLYITGAALRAERAEPGDLVAALRGWRNGKAAEGAQGRGTALSNVAERGRTSLLRQPGLAQPSIKSGFI